MPIKKKKGCLAKKYISLGLVVVILSFGFIFGTNYLARALSAYSTKTITVEGDYIEQAPILPEEHVASVVIEEMLKSTRLVQDDFVYGLKVDGKEFVDEHRKVQASNLIQCKTFRLPDPSKQIHATSSNGAFNFEIPTSTDGGWIAINGGWIDVTDKTPTTSYSLKIGLLASTTASTSIAYDESTYPSSTAPYLAFDDVYASNTSNLANIFVATTTKDRILYFNSSNVFGMSGTVLNGNAGGFNFGATSTMNGNTAVDMFENLVVYASTSFESSDRGMFGGEDPNSNASTTPVWGDMTICYTEYGSTESH